MIGIFQDSFIDYLRENLGDPVKVKTKNIVCRCPWCEYKKVKRHYHLYISLEAPIFHCFYQCGEGGNIRKLLRKIEGHDILDRFVDIEKIKESKKRVSFAFTKKEELVVNVPTLDEKRFTYKTFYMRKRLKFANVDLKTIKGLVFDINEFITMNEVAVDPSLFRVKDYLHSNFIGFLTEHSSLLMLRNIDHKSDFPFFKLKIQEQPFLDYYQLRGNNPESNKVVLAEGIFDIFSEHIFDSLNIKDSVRLYACALSSNYDSLIKSIVFYEQVFRPEIIVLSDKGVERYYKKFKERNRHVVENLSVYYNQRGKDFADTPVFPIKIVV